MGRRSLECRTGAWVSRLEPLESRLLLTNLVAVTVSGGAVTLTDHSGGASTGDNFTVSYTSNQVVLTGQSGTSFTVGSQTLTTYTANVSSPISLTMFLGPNANVVSVTGDGTTTLSSVDIHLGSGNPSNSFTMTKVLADSVSFNGGGDGNDITLSQCTVSGNLWASIGYSSGDILDLEKTNVTGNVTDFVGTLTLNQVTISGTFTDYQLANNSIYNSTDATYVGDVTVTMGKYGTVNYEYSSLGVNHTDSHVFFHGVFRHRDISIYLGNSSQTATPAYTVTFADYPYQIHASLKLATSTTTATTAPTVNNLVATTTTPTITGTYSTSTKYPSALTVAVNGTTYTLGTSPQLTSPSAGTWSLNLAAVTGAPAAPLPTTTSNFTVTVTTTDSFGNQLTGTGTVSTAPTVNNLAAATTTPTITGTYATSTTNSPVLTVAVNGITYTLGTSPQLTSPSAGNWSLNLAAVTGAAAAPLPTTTSSFTVTATTTDSLGNKLTGTGTVTNEQAIIQTYLTAQNLTATNTSTGLDYVITTNGTGAVPTNGQSVTVNYQGYLLNANGTQGTEFDSNIDSQFGHVTPFSFTLGAGQVIAGWDQAFALLPVGTVATLLIPSALGYGTAGSGSTIPANSILIFKVTVVSAT